MVKRLPTMWETGVRSLGLEDPLEKEMATTPVLLPGKSHGWRSMVGYSPWGPKESDMTEWHHFHFQITGREHSPTLQQKIGLKIYWAWPHPSEEDPVSPSVSLSHQEASINLLSFSIRGKTEWKPQSQKLTNLITWTTTLSNSMKLWAMPCRATQDRWVMVESSDKTWSTGEGSGKLLQYSCLENTWTVWKGKR